MVPVIWLLLWLVSVNVRSTTWPTATVAKSIAVGLTLHARTAGVIPIPLQATVQAPTPIEQVFAPAALGAKRSANVAAWPAVRLNEPLPRREKSAQLSVTTPVRVPPPTFVTVIVVSRWAPMVTLPKAMVPGATEQAGSCGPGSVGPWSPLEQPQTMRKRRTTRAIKRRMAKSSGCGGESGIELRRIRLDNPWRRFE